MNTTANDLFTEDAPIMPEGGLDVDDFTTEEDFSDQEEQTEESEQATDVEGAPTPESQNPDAEGAEDPAPTTEPAEPAPQKLRFRAKIDREESDVELDPSELPSIYQKARNHDRAKERLEKSNALIKALREVSVQLGYQSPEEMLEGLSQSNRKSQIDALVAGGTAQEIAEFYVDAQARAKKTAIQIDEHDDVTEPVAPAKKDDLLTDYRKQVDELFAARPDLKGHLTELPKAVSDAVIGGTPVRVAYAEWENAQMKAERDRLRKERDALAQKAEAATRAPVRSVTKGGGKSTADEKDPFLIGLNSEW